ncbi:hypothetical protein ABZ477_14525 [Microbacterium sp. NPDC019599]|uniref:hypothetical protein n=1 Tax=Microbacterium sp. NPDC019599 TaxID=3154690 RepID=UPI0034048151
MTEDPESEASSATPSSTPALFLVVTTAELKDVVRSATYLARDRVATRPSLEGVTIVGPARSTRTVGQWLRGSDDVGEPVWKALRDSIPDVAVAPGGQLLLGVVVLDRQPTAVADRVAALRASPRLKGVPLQVHGLSVDGRSVDADESVGESGRAGRAERNPGATVRDGLDVALLSTIEEAMLGAEEDPALLIPEPMIVELFAGRTVRREPARGVRAVPLRDADEAASHASLLAARTGQRAEEPLASEPAPPLVNAAPVVSRPLRRVYIVAGAGLESRPRKVRRRLGELVESLDRALLSSDSETTGYTWLVAAGTPRFSEPIVRPSGTLKAADLPRSSATSVDMRATMRGVAALVSSNEASFRRRGQPLTPAVVVFVLPSAILPGPTTLGAYRAIKNLATVGWLVTDSAVRTPNRDIDLATLVYDKDDAASELASALRDAELDASDLDSVLRDLENEMQNG